MTAGPARGRGHPAAQTTRGSQPPRPRCSTDAARTMPTPHTAGRIAIRARASAARMQRAQRSRERRLAPRSRPAQAELRPRSPSESRRHWQASIRAILAGRARAFPAPVPASPPIARGRTPATPWNSVSSSRVRTPAAGVRRRRIATSRPRRMTARTLARARPKGPRPGPRPATTATRARQCRAGRATIPRSRPAASAACVRPALQPQQASRRPTPPGRRKASRLCAPGCARSTSRCGGRAQARRHRRTVRMP